MSKSDELREHLFQKGPWYAGVIYSPQQNVMEPFSTNSMGRYLDEVIHSESMGYKGHPLDFGVVYYEEYVFGQEKVMLRLKELEALSKEELRQLVTKVNPELKVLYAI